MRRSTCRSANSEASGDERKPPCGRGSATPAHCRSSPNRHAPGIRRQAVPPPRHAHARGEHLDRRAAHARARVGPHRNRHAVPVRPLRRTPGLRSPSLRVAFLRNASKPGFPVGRFPSARARRAHVRQRITPPGACFASLGGRSGSAPAIQPEREANEFPYVMPSRTAPSRVCCAIMAATAIRTAKELP